MRIQVIEDEAKVARALAKGLTEQGHQVSLAATGEDGFYQVLHALREANINIVALHNHMIGEQPAFYFTHFWGTGSAADLAKGIKAALDAQQASAASNGHH